MQHLNDFVDFQVFEKSADIGGTWFENRYPGCACDVPSHCYQYSFAPNPSWSKFYASSQEIYAYLKGVVKHFDLERYISLNTKVVSARWSEEAGTWTIELDNGTIVTSEVLFNASGILSHPQLPNLEGLSTFSGSLLHTAAWDSSIDLRGSVEATADYFIRLLHKMIRQHVRSFESCKTWSGQEPAGAGVNKQGPNGKVTGIWAGSSLHYIQVLSEDRWEDYEWEYKSERYSYWGHGLSWIEEPDLDPLGARRQDMIEAMTTIPKKDSDLSFYLWKSGPLPKACIPPVAGVKAENGGKATEVEGQPKDVGNSSVNDSAAVPMGIDAQVNGTCISVPVYYKLEYQKKLVRFECPDKQFEEICVYSKIAFFNHNI
ncbi:hypothetical protein F53441_6384 [Fusarium austroafricanum]|uniref:Uncharacterized protein n=1 Tax=Fusarium austroafricanum TaxID=2364996 RepID=A0A8H4KIX3_9HYPO|nr:hypothetical protein F53441_6384 [Fusarium austroafricanum]